MTVHWYSQNKDLFCIISDAKASYIRLLLLSCGATASMRPIPDLLSSPRAQLCSSMKNIDHIEGCLHPHSTCILRTVNINQYYWDAVTWGTVKLFKLLGFVKNIKAGRDVSSWVSEAFPVPCASNLVLEVRQDPVGRGPRGPAAPFPLPLFYIHQLPRDRAGPDPAAPVRLSFPWALSFQQDRDLPWLLSLRDHPCLP